MRTLILSLSGLLTLIVGGLTQAADPAIERAIAFLAREVPRWHAENKCYSCHNNADAVRALAVARQQGYAVPDEALADSLRWLHRVDDWRHNGGEGEFNDYELAAIQFGSALVTATAPEKPNLPRGADSQAAIRAAARRVAEPQRDDGAWFTGPGNSIGSPATYGPPLATLAAVELLIAADDPALTSTIEKADGWLDRYEPKTVFDAAAILYGRSRLSQPPPEQQSAACLALLEAGRHADGGWGPYVHSPSEPFDTALVLLAIRRIPAEKQPDHWIAAGRRYLLSTQFDDGSWPETTRPAGRESYAQRLSTTAWATLALLATDPDKK